MLLVGALVAGALLSPLAVQISQASEASRRGLDDRQASRAALARQFVDTYVADLLARVETTAELTVAGPAPSDSDLLLAVRQLQMDAAVLLDGEGRLLQVVPARADLIGQTLTDRYDHLRIARDGRPTVSGVVPSAADGSPIVAFAVPFTTPAGPRVLSGGFSIERTPLGAFLRSFSPLSGSSVYLVDRAGTIADTNVKDHRSTLAEQDPGLASAVGERRVGLYAGTDGERFFVTEATATAPWELVFSVPTTSLYASIAPASVLPWLLFAAFAAAATTSVVLVARVLHQRRQLVHLAEHDALTGLYNRRHVDAELDRLTHRSAREGRPLAVLLIDVDHFKRINDEHGHHRGDEVLQRVADTLAAHVRTGDIVCRWGGEEFMVLAPDTGPDQAAALAERLRRAIVAGVAVDDRPVTASVGYAVDGAHRVRPESDRRPAEGHDAEVVAARADRALYRAKAAGRNRVATVDAVSV